MIAFTHGKPCPKNKNGKAQKSHRQYILCYFEYCDEILHHLVFLPRTCIISWSRSPCCGHYSHLSHLVTILVTRSATMITRCLWGVWSLGHPLGGRGIRTYPSEVRGKLYSWRQGIIGEAPKELVFFCVIVGQDGPGRLAGWGAWQCLHISPRRQGYRWSCLVMKTSCRFNVREASHSSFTQEKGQNGMEAVFPIA